VVRHASTNIAALRAATKDYQNATLIALDLAFVINATHEIGARTRPPGSQFDEKEGTVPQALWIAAAVSYVRCFKTNRRRVALRAADVEKHPLNAGGVHEYITDLRNRHFAHTDADYEGVAVSLLIQRQAGTPDRFGGFSMLGAKLVGGTREQARQLNTLARALHADQLAKAEVLKAEIQEIGRSLSHEELKELELTQRPEETLGPLAEVRKVLRDAGMGR
jgi:hypothetical protein